MSLKRYKIVSILVFSFLLKTEINAQKFQYIPTQRIDLFTQIGDVKRSKVDTINSFEISDFITYREYKRYLNSVKVDSSNLFYNSQFPDSSIAIDKSVYKEYVTDKIYDKYPVLGISWENAMNYCKWKTLKDNKKGSIKFIYLLPHHSEWIAALLYFKKEGITNDLDDKYSDWLLNNYDESYNFDWAMDFDYVYFHKETDPMVLKRKSVVGNSYLYYILNRRYGYSTIGYRQTSFRLVKTKVNQFVLNYWGIEE